MTVKGVIPGFTLSLERICYVLRGGVWRSSVNFSVFSGIPKGYVP